jgi:hypothetical protein
MKKFWLENQASYPIWGSSNHFLIRKSQAALGICSAFPSHKPTTQKFLTLKLNQTKAGHEQKLEGIVEWVILAEICGHPHWQWSRSCRTWYRWVTQPATVCTSTTSSPLSSTSRPSQHKQKKKITRLIRWRWFNWNHIELPVAAAAQHGAM